MTQNEQRTYLESRGWKRADRVLGGTSVELWVSPEGGSLTLLAAVRQQTKTDNAPVKT